MTSAMSVYMDLLRGALTDAAKAAQCFLPTERGDISDLSAIRSQRPFVFVHAR